MRLLLLIIISFFFIRPLTAHDISANKKVIFGTNGGVGASYTDKVFLLNLQGSYTLDYFVNNNLSIQLAPKYTWLIKWNEHYLTLPIHLRKKIGERFSVFAGPSLTFDIGYFKDLGISAGVYYHFSKKQAFILSAYTFTLYDYNIDYIFIPVGIAYNYMFLK